MFTVIQIENAHSEVKSGADFPKYIQNIKKLGVQSFVTWVKDSHTEYFGTDQFSTKSTSKYEDLIIAKSTNKEAFLNRLKAHQNGETDYFTFCKDCAENGIEKWVINLDGMTCIYYNQTGEEILSEKIPAS